MVNRIKKRPHLKNLGTKKLSLTMAGLLEGLIWQLYFSFVRLLSNSNCPRSCLYERERERRRNNYSTALTDFVRIPSHSDIDILAIIIIIRTELNLNPPKFIHAKAMTIISGAPGLIMPPVVVVDDQLLLMSSHDPESQSPRSSGTTTMPDRLTHPWPNSSME